MAKVTALRVRLLVLVLSLLAATVPAWTARAAGAGTAAPAPVVRQLITVTAASYGTTYATSVSYTHLTLPTTERV